MLKISTNFKIDQVAISSLVDELRGLISKLYSCSEEKIWIKLSVDTQQIIDFGDGSKDNWLVFELCYFENDGENPIGVLLKTITDTCKKQLSCRVIGRFDRNLPGELIWDGKLLEKGI